jgi:pilus assembly protein CpaE
MENKILQVGLLTADAQRAETVAQQVRRLNWQFTPVVGVKLSYEALQRQRPDLMLIDLDTPNALMLFAEASRILPDVPLLALTTPQHFNRLREVMEAGAADFVVFPTEASELALVAQRVAKQPHQPASVPRKNSRMIAVTSLRGGVGRSTLATNLAIALRQRLTSEVILAEVHHNLSQLSLMLNLHPRHSLQTLSNVIVDHDIVEGVLQLHGSGIRLLAAPSDLSQLVDLSIENWQHILSLLLELAPYVVVDTVAIADAVLSEVLTHADEIIIMLQPDIFSLRSTLSLLETLRGEPAIHGRIHLVLNRADIRGGLDEAVIEKQLNQKLAISMPDDAPLATYALNRGVPFIGSHPQSLLSRRINALVDLVADQVGTATNGQTSRLQKGLIPFLNILK